MLIVNIPGVCHAKSIYVMSLLLLSLQCHAENRAAQEILRQHERERILREQQEIAPDIRLPTLSTGTTPHYPAHESPCFVINDILLTGVDAPAFAWVLPEVAQAKGRCLGTTGINMVMSQLQNAMVARGFVTTRVLAAPQDLTQGTLTLTVVAGRIRHILFAPGTPSRATARNAVPARRGDLLNLRDIEQALENFKRLPTVEADIQITPAQGDDAKPGESDLVIAWKQRSPPVRVSASLDDSGSKATGKMQGSFTLSLDDLLALNDLLYVNFNHDVFNGNSKGTQGYTAHLSVPYSYWSLGTTLSGYEYRQTVAGARLHYVYRGTSDNAEVKLSRLLYRDAVRKSGAYLTGWMRRSSNFIDDTEVEVQRRRTGGWSAGLTHREYLGASTLDGNLGYRRGTGAFDAMAAPEELFDEGTSRMALITADVELMMPFQLGAQTLRYTGNIRTQWDRTPLVPQDRFSIGGRYSVRGFDGELTLMGERGWVWRNELGLALGAGQSVYLGADYGHVGGNSTRWLNGRDLAGAVIGLRGGMSGFAWDLFVGGPLHKPEGFQTSALTTGFNVNWSY